MKMSFAASMATIVLAIGTPAQAHELWFQPPSGPSAATVRLTFADVPDPGEAERVAEIAHAKVWADGVPLEVERQAEGLTARLPSARPMVLSAYAHRGVVDYGGDSFVITLAAYAQSRPLAAGDVPRLGLDDDQLRLLLVADAGGNRKLRATWRGKPAAGIDVRTFIGDESSDSKTDANGELPCPEVGKAGVSLLAQHREMTPGLLEGKAFTHTRYKATLNLVPAPGEGDPTPDERLARVREVHGGAGPWAVAGYRIGEQALKALGRPRHSFALLVVHRSPAEVQYSCVADGLMAATGASPGKLNLKLEEVPPERLSTTVEDRESGRTLTFTIRPELVQSIRDLPMERLEAEGRRVAELPDAAIFTVVEERAAGGK
ncbi:FmdE family protein [Tundrisphaera lichenicola]|uniref:FmdE family protein n=1 Tax=Tundrisphaera lichenicola TaxID=2029860 RepID=UPI003EBBAF7A